MNQKKRAPLIQVNEQVDGRFILFNLHRRTLGVGEGRNTSIEINLIQASGIPRCGW